MKDGRRRIPATRKVSPHGRVAVGGREALGQEELATYYGTVRRPAREHARPLMTMALERVALPDAWASGRGKKTLTGLIHLSLVRPGRR